MLSLNESDILTRIARYNLIRNERLIYIDEENSWPYPIS
jgi:hypothetical protein